MKKSLLHFLNSSQFNTEQSLQASYKGPDKRGHIVADTLLPTQMFPRSPAHATFVADTNFVSGTQKMFLISDFVQKHFVSATNFSQFCAAQETSWATMCPQQCVLVYQGLKWVNSSRNGHVTSFPTIYYVFGLPL